MRVLLVDDHRLLIEGLSNLLTVNHFEVVGIAFNGSEAVRLAGQLKPDLILMDIRMPVCGGLEATRRIKALQPDARVIMLTTAADDDDLFEAVRSGAIGYLLKSMSGEDFIQALKGIEQGLLPFSPGLADRLLREFNRLSDPASPPAPCQPHHPSEVHIPTPAPLLTERQAEVLRLIAEGLTYKEIGARLSLSERTVRYHIKEILERLHLEHRSQAIAYAARLGIEKP